MQRARSLAPRNRKAPRFEAILAATLMHTEPGDYISPPPASPSAALLATERTTPKTRKKTAPTTPTPLPTTQRLATAAGIAQGLKLSATKKIALYYTDANTASARTEAGWAEALAYANEASLPLLLIVADITGTSAPSNPKAISWPSISRLCRRTKLPVLTVDGADAVAVYRVMQESTHRARMGDGAAVLWCVLPPAPDRSPTTDPIRNMQRYLTARNLLPRK